MDENVSHQGRRFQAFRGQDGVTSVEDSTHPQGMDKGVTSSRNALIDGARFRDADPYAPDGSFRADRNPART
jgi:hypothetical protein